MRSSSGGDFSVFRLVGIVLRERYWVLGCTVGVAALVVVLTLITFRPVYTAQVSFVPQGAQRAGSGGLQAAVAQFGLNVPVGGGSESPQFYADLLRSRQILRTVLADSFSVDDYRHGEGTHHRGTILDLLDIREEREGRRQEAGLRWLRNYTAVSVTRDTGLVQLWVTTPWPSLSKDLARRLVDEVNEFNLRTRQSQASAERAFIETRLVEARRELREAEDELRRFLEENRQFRNSPQLLFEHDHLQRQVAMRQQLLTSLNESYENARIAEVRDTPVITVVDPPTEPARRDPRGLFARGILGLMLGAGLGVFIAFGREMMVQGRSDKRLHYEEFQEAWADTVNDLRAIFGPRRA